jgi:hypothetical protein
MLTTFLTVGCNVRMSDVKAEDGTVLTVSDGYVSRGNELSYRTDSPEMRGIFAFPRHKRGSTDATLDFIYEGEPEQVSQLGNGEVRHQIGLKLFAKDSCNLLYVMVRLEPDGMAGLYVSTKLNPGESTSDECADRGYVSLAGNIPLGPIDLGSAHRLTATWDSDWSEMYLDFDDEAVATIPLDGQTLYLLGSETGIRSDNMVAEFSVTPL